MATLARSKTQAVHVRVNGHDFGIWDAMSGGAVTSDAPPDPFEPGGMGPAIALGGSSAKTGNVTLRKHIEPDFWRDQQLLVNAVKNGGQIEIVRHLLVAQGDPGPFGPGHTYNGKVVGWTPPDHDASSNDVIMVEIEAQIDGLPSLS